MNRVMIIGGSGAGKTTVARRLGAITGIPAIHIDPMYWKPGWVARDKEETVRMVRDAAQTERWIFDGNNSTTFDDRLRRADTLVFLDMSTFRRLWRVLLRTLRGYGQVRPGSQADCPERFDWAFLMWVVSYRFHGRRKALALMARASDDVNLHHLRTPNEVDVFLRDSQRLV